MPDNTEKPIAFASRTLTKSEKHYSQIDKEALSIIFGVKKFFQYLYGHRFILYTDSKPLVSIFAPDKSIPLLSAARMQRYALYLQSFHYDIRYKKTTDHGNADALSRLPLRSEDLHTIDETTIFQISQLEVLAVNARDLATSTRTDPILKTLFSLLISGQDIPKQFLFGGKPEEFTLEQGCILKGCRVVIPTVHRRQILNELHTGHFGIVKMKMLARSFIWWPGIDKDIEKLVKNCSICTHMKNNPPKMDVHHWEWPSTPWQRIHVDFAGPVHGKMFLIVVDAHSKWPEVFILNKTTTERTINCLSSLFSRYGFPISLVSDNGPQFTSEDFKIFLRNHGIQHRLTAPYHPATNGQAERYVQTVKRGLKSLEKEAGTLQQKLDRFLLQYRKMPHSTTGESPAYLFLKRNIRTRLDLVLPSTGDRVRDKQSSSKRKHSRSREFEVGAKVAVRNYTTDGKWKVGYVVRRLGKVHYEVQVGSSVWKRHIDQITSAGSELPIEDDAPMSPIRSTVENTGNGYAAEWRGYPPPLQPESEATPASIHMDPVTIPSSQVDMAIDPVTTPSSQVDMATNGADSVDVSAGRIQHAEPPSALRRSTRTRKPPDRLQYT